MSRLGRLRKWLRVISANHCFVYDTRDGLEQLGGGAYAWYLRLDKLLGANPDVLEFVNLAKSFYQYDARCAGLWRGEYRLEGANRKSFVVSASYSCPSVWSSSGGQPSAALQRLFAGASEGDGYSDLKLMLAQASLCMPPLYVGKTISFASRYRQHLAGQGESSDNTFGRRFRLFTEELGLDLSMKDLLYRCVPDQFDYLHEEEGISREEAGLGLEQLLQSIEMPPFCHS